MASLRTSMSLARGAFKPARSMPKLAAPRTSVSIRASLQKDQAQAPAADVVSSSMMLSMVSMLASAPALADDIVGVTPKIGGFNPLEIFIVVAPISVYALFYLFRAKVNPRAGFGDLALIAVSFTILANIFSIVVFKVRYF